MKKTIEICPLCYNYFPRLLKNGRWYCNNCGAEWEDEDHIDKNIKLKTDGKK